MARKTAKTDVVSKKPDSLATLNLRSIRHGRVRRLLMSELFRPGTVGARYDEVYNEQYKEIYTEKYTEIYTDRA